MSARPLPTFLLPHADRVRAECDALRVWRPDEFLAAARVAGVSREKLARQLRHLERSAAPEDLHPDLRILAHAAEAEGAMSLTEAEAAEAAQPMTRAPDTLAGWLAALEADGWERRKTGGEWSGPARCAGAPTASTSLQTLAWRERPRRWLARWALHAPGATGTPPRIPDESKGGSHRGWGTCP